MKKIVYYECEYCKCRTRNLLKFKEHEKKCKFICDNQVNAINRIRSLIMHYYNLGYTVTVVFHSPEECIINVHHKDFGKF